MFEPFFTRCPELVGHETLSFTTRPHSLLPADEYGLIELYCSEASCDCRRVLFFVTRLSDDSIVAALNYGWETQAFYRQWSPHDPSPNALSGVVVDPEHPQTALSGPLQIVVQNLVSEDHDYRAILKRHYRLFKAALIPSASRRPAINRTPA